jgi:hypothetical protein
MKFGGLEGKRVRVIFTDGETLIGIAADHTSALNNPEEKESLCIGSVIFFEDEVREIQEIEA